MRKSNPAVFFSMNTKRFAPEVPPPPPPLRDAVAPLGP